MSDRQNKGSEQDNSGEETRAAKGIEFKDGLYVLFGTGLVYLFCFNTQKAYLAFFGVDTSFLQIDVVTLAFSGSVGIAFCLTIWVVVSNMPVPLLLRALQVWIAFLPVWLIIFFAVLTYVYSGVTWAFVLLSVLTLTVCIFFMLSLIFHLRRGKSLAEWFAKQIDDEIKARDLTVQVKILDAVDGQIRLLVFAGLVLVSLIAPLVGRYHASTKSDFITFETTDGLFAIISKYEGGILAVGVDLPSDPDNPLILNGKVRWQPLDRLNDLDFALASPRQRIGRVTVERVRVSMAEFCIDNGFSFCAN